MENEEMVLAELSEKSDAQLREVLDSLYQEEQQLSYRRRLLHAKIDILRAELTARLKEKYKQGTGIISGKDLERLTEILAKEMPRKMDL